MLCCTADGIQGDILTMSSCGHRSRGKGRDDMIGYSAARNHRNCVICQYRGKCDWDQELGQIECVLCCMVWWCQSPQKSFKYILDSVWSISVICVSQYTSWKCAPAKQIGGGSSEMLIFLLHYDLCPDFHKRLRDFIYCLSDDGYCCVCHFCWVL